MHPPAQLLLSCGNTVLVLHWAARSATTTGPKLGGCAAMSSTTRMNKEQKMAATTLNMRFGHRLFISGRLVQAMPGMYVMRLFGYYNTGPNHTRAWGNTQVVL